MKFIITSDGSYNDCGHDEEPKFHISNELRVHYPLDFNSNYLTQQTRARLVPNHEKFIIEYSGARRLDKVGVENRVRSIGDDTAQSIEAEYEEVYRLHSLYLDAKQHLEASLQQAWGKADAIDVEVIRDACEVAELERVKREEEKAVEAAAANLEYEERRAARLDLKAKNLREKAARQRAERSAKS